MCRLGLSVHDRALKEGLGEAVGAAEGEGGVGRSGGVIGVTWDRRRNCVGYD